MSLRRLAVGHGCVDVYQGAVAALVPVFVAERAWTYAAVSGLMVAASLLSSVTQPLFGLLTDRFVMPWLVPVSTLLAGAGVVAGALTASYPMTLVCMAAAGAGVAAYHPEAARQARAASGGSHRGMAWFSLGGNLGFAAAPLLVAVGSLPVLAIPALAGAVLCLRGPAARPVAGRTTGKGRNDTRSFAVLTLAIICRSIVFAGLSAFLALYARDRGQSGTLALFLLYLGGAIGTVAGGRLADRWGRVAVVRLSYLLTVAAVAGVVLAPGPAFPVCVALTSAGLYVPFSLQITLAQDYLPGYAGVASGVTLGLTVSAGGLAVPLLGALADVTDLRTALLPLIVVPFVAWSVTRRLTEPRS